MGTTCKSELFLRGITRVKGVRLDLEANTYTYYKLYMQKIRENR